MKKFLGMFATALLAAFILLWLTQSGLIPWGKIALKNYQVPDLEGLKKESAEIVCKVKGLAMFIADEVYTDSAGPGKVVSQSPAPYARAKFPEVEVVISKGSPVITVPDVRGLDIETAKKRLQSVKIDIAEIEYVAAPDEKDKVLSTFPLGGATIRPDTKISLKVSKGEEKVTVPLLSGRTLADASQILKSKDLTMGTVKKEIDIERRFGIILRQWPPAGREVSKGSPVTIVLNEEE